MSLIGTIMVGRHPKLLLRSKRGSVNKQAVRRFLIELKKHSAGRKLLLLWDGLPAHRAKIVSEFIIENRNWLRVERLPAYAPEYNPVEYLWSALKKTAGNARLDLNAISKETRKARRRFSNERLLSGFLRASHLYD